MWIRLYRVTDGDKPVVVLLLVWCVIDNDWQTTAQRWRRILRSVKQQRRCSDTSKTGLSHTGHDWLTHCCDTAGLTPRCRFRYVNTHILCLWKLVKSSFTDVVQTTLGTKSHSHPVDVFCFLLRMCTVLATQTASSVVTACCACEVCSVLTHCAVICGSWLLCVNQYASPLPRIVRAVKTTIIDRWSVV